MTTATLLEADALESGAEAGGKPSALPADTLAAALTVRATFGAEARGEVLVAVYARPPGGEWDTQAAQVFHLTAPGAAGTAQRTVALAVLAAQEVRATARWAGSCRAEALRVTMVTSSGGAGS